MAAHSQIGASGMHRWEPCPGSVALCAPIPNRTSDAADEGTRAHAVLEAILTTGEVPPGVSVEMLEAVMVVVNSIYEDERSVAALYSSKRWLEHPVDLTALSPDLKGTADVVVYYPASTLLQVWDYKHGIGEVVEVKENPQLMYYALGALMNLEKEFTKGVNHVELIIGQPRAAHSDGPIRRWTTTATYLKEVFAPRLKLAAEKTREKNAPLVPGQKQCRWCLAKPICPAVHKKALEVAKIEFKPAFSYDEEKLGALIEWFPTLKTWIKDTEEFAENELKAGKNIPGWKLVNGRGSREWRPGTDGELLSLETGIEAHKFYSRDLLSPAQAEKLVGNKSLLDPLIVKKQGGLTLAPESDKRPAARNDVNVDFQDISFLN